MAQTYPTISFKDYRIFWVHGNLTLEVRDRIVQFWLDHKALADPVEAQRRTGEVGCIVINEKAELVGVNTVYVGETAPGRRYWFYRTFVRPDSRRTGLTRRVFRFTAKKLAEQPRGPGDPVGIVAVAENPKLARPGGRRFLQTLGFTERGVTPQGLAVWVLDFEQPQPSPASTV